MTKTSKPEDFPIFGSLDKQTLKRMLHQLEGYLRNLSDVLKFDTSTIEISMQVMLEIIERVEKRRVYFHVFYNGCKMGELNEGALFCYWILKLHPFSCPGIYSNVLNAKIALCLFINTIYSYSSAKGKIAALSPQYLNDVYYSFRYRDLSKEALMVTIESFG
ncbi:MAG: hypothetical protein LBL20_08420 [Treponema sp.]|jgi:hypothetical protein|nr:hypothetical protein [Treponema sp.]